MEMELNEPKLGCLIQEHVTSLYTNKKSEMETVYVIKQHVNL